MINHKSIHSISFVDEKTSEKDFAKPGTRKLRFRAKPPTKHAHFCQKFVFVIFVRRNKQCISNTYV